jgi:hypothetical protein
VSVGRRPTGFGTIAGVGALAVLCCVALPAVFGAITGAAIGGVAGEGAAALVALVAVALLYRRRRARGSRC